jgi:hypothetical protein
MQYALVIGQIMVVVFLAFHDWVPLSACCSCISHLHAPMIIMTNCASFPT